MDRTAEVPTLKSRNRIKARATAVDLFPLLLPSTFKKVTSQTPVFLSSPKKAHLTIHRLSVSLPDVSRLTGISIEDKQVGRSADRTGKINKN